MVLDSFFLSLGLLISSVLLNGQLSCVVEESFNFDLGHYVTLVDYSQLVVY